jgi:predicted dienelactone hydrolase
MKQQLTWICAASLLVVGAVMIVSGCGFRRAAAQSRLSAMESRWAVNDQQAATSIRTQAGQSVRAERAEIAGLKVALWYPANYGRAPVPLVVFSHGFHGVNTQSTFLMKALAEAGYLAVAPNHRDAGWGRGQGGKPQVGFADAHNWNDATYRDRADDIRLLLHTMQQDPTWSGAVDWSRIALAGHSLGGYTVLGLAGAWSTWRLPEVKAVLALSPYYMPFIFKDTLKGIKAPVMYQGGTRDFGITPYIKGSGAYQQTPQPAYFVNFDGAGHLAWTDLNPKYQASIAYYSIAFLDRYVRGDSNSDPTRRRPDVKELLAK